MRVARKGEKVEGKEEKVKTEESEKKDATEEEVEEVELSEDDLRALNEFSHDLSHAGGVVSEMLYEDFMNPERANALLLLKHGTTFLKLDGGVLHSFHTYVQDVEQAEAEARESVKKEEEVEE